MSDILLDDEFFSQIDAVESAILNRKRQKIEKNESIETSEGAYIAALKGSKSIFWQSKNMKELEGRSKVKIDLSNEPLKVAGSDECFKCGKSGHWARNCTWSGNEGQGKRTTSEKPCPCGLGDCLILTANTERNLGRKFYKCPVRKENGGCGFFEWCDSPDGNINLKSNGNPFNNSSVEKMQCPCGSGYCLVFTAKTGKNVGQQFYRCPLNQDEGHCGFFKWCNELKPIKNLSSTTTSSYNASHFSGERGGSSYFKSGKGYGARDCIDTNHLRCGTGNPCPDYIRATSSQKFDI